MDYDSMKVFVHLTETLHYGKTSKACNISPSTLSRVIKRLENSLGEQLFDRNNRSVQLTATGEQFRKYAKDTLSRWQAFQNSLEKQSGVLSGEISMYCTITASYGVLPEILVRFRKAYPEVNIKLLTGESGMAIQKVVEGDADFAVAALPDRITENLCLKAITDVQLQFIAPSISWPFMDNIHTKDIPWEHIPMVVVAKGMARKRIDAWFRSRHIKPNIYAQVSGNESILAMVSLGFGVGIVPELVLEKKILAIDIQVLDVQPSIEPYSVGICVQKRRLKNPLVKAFWEIIEGS